MELLWLLGRMAVVFVLLAVVLQLLKRSDSLRGRSRTGGLQVMSSTRLGKAATLSIVELDGRRLVLGVTASSVTVLTEVEATAAAEAAETAEDGSAAEPAAAPSFAALLAASRSLVPAPRRSPDAVTPPTAAAFLADVWRSARRQPIETAEVSPAAIAAAIALASGADTPTPVQLDPNTAADGPAAPRARASRRTAPRTDAQRLEETRPWSRVRPAAAPSADRTAVV